MVRLTIDDSKLSGNTADYFYGTGGGIDNEYGETLTINRSILSGNSAAYGGGIFNNFSTATVSRCELSDNSATYSGGGIDNEGGTLTVNNSSSITGNTAPVGFGADVFNNSLNGGVLLVDSTSTIGIFDV